MPPAPPKIDYTKLPPAKLRDLMHRYEAQGYPELAKACLSELSRRGAALRRDYSLLPWNQQSVAEALAPFRIIASFEGNKRTAYTEAGGAKIGRKRGEAGWMWVDSYSAMAIAGASWAFSCQIETSGADPVFRLHDAQTVVATYTSNELPNALKRWGEIGNQLRAQMPTTTPS